MSTLISLVSCHLNGRGDRIREGINLIETVSQRIELKRPGQGYGVVGIGPSELDKWARNTRLMIRVLRQQILEHHRARFFQYYIALDHFLVKSHSHNYFEARFLSSAPRRLILLASISLVKWLLTPLGEPQQAQHCACRMTLSPPSDACPTVYSRGTVRSSCL